MADFIPDADGDLITWCENNIAKIDLYGPGTAANLPTKQVTKVKDESQSKIDSINAKTQAEETYRSKVTADTQTTLTVLRKEIGDVKRLDTVDDEMLKNLKWISVPKDIDPDTAKPIVKEERIVDHYKFTYNLQGFFDGIVAYRKKPEDADFVRQREDHSSPWFENEQIPSGTEYKFVYLLKEDEVGQWSDIITIDV